MIRKVLYIIILIIILPSFTYGTDNTGILSVETIEPKVKLGSDLKINVNLNKINQVYGIHIILKFDPNYLKSNKNLIDLGKEIKERNHFIAINKIDSTNGKVELMLTLLGNEQPLNSETLIGAIEFQGIKTGLTNITIEKSKLLTKDGSKISYNTKNSTINIETRNKNKVLKDTDTTNTTYIDYSDVDDCWAKDYINKLTIMGIVNGKGSKKFAPKDYVTRTEIAKVLSLALDLEEENDSCSFNDTDSIPDWAKSHVNKLVENGITQGYDDNTFRPDSYISRIELATMLDRALKNHGVKIPENNSMEIFIDDKNIPQWGREAVYNLKLLNIISGYEDGSFRGNKPITRAEVCKVIVKFLEVIDVI